MITPLVKVPVPAGMKSPMKSYSMAEMKSTSVSSNDINKTHAVSQITLDQVSQSVQNGYTALLSIWIGH